MTNSIKQRNREIIKFNQTQPNILAGPIVHFTTDKCPHLDITLYRNYVYVLLDYHNDKNKLKIDDQKMYTSMTVCSGSERERHSLVQSLFSLP